MTDFLVGLLNTPSPTGYSLEAIDYVQKAFDALDLPTLTTSLTDKGALLVYWGAVEPNQKRPVALTAHIDTLGLMVKEINPNGRLKTTMLGGFDWNAVEFEGVTIRTFDNKRYRGTMMPQNASFHVNRDVRNMTRGQDTMEVRVDAKTNSAEETRELGIDVGDFNFLDPRVEVTDTGFIRSRHLDDKAGVAVIYGAMLAMQAANVAPMRDTYILIANYEEVGHGGASGLNYESLEELLAIDMAAVGNGQTSDEYSVTICVKDATGPYHFDMNNKLRRLASKYEIDAKIDIYPGYGSDGSAYWRAGGGAKVGLIGPGVEASHAYERTHQDSLYDSAHLIARYLLDDEA